MDRTNYQYLCLQRVTDQHEAIVIGRTRTFALTVYIDCIIGDRFADGWGTTLLSWKCNKVGIIRDTDIRLSVSHVGGLWWSCNAYGNKSYTTRKLIHSADAIWRTPLQMLLSPPIFCGKGAPVPRINASHLLHRHSNSRGPINTNLKSWIIIIR